jgi:hypothetical protein
MLLVLQRTEGSYDDYTEPVDSVWDVPRETIDVRNEWTAWLFTLLNQELAPQYELKKNPYNNELNIYPIGKHNVRRNQLFAALKNQYNIEYWLENKIGAKKLDFVAHVKWY